MKISKKTLYIFDKLVLFTLMFLVMGFAIDYKQIEYQCNIGAFENTPWAEIVENTDPGLVERILFDDYGHYKIIQNKTTADYFKPTTFEDIQGLTLKPPTQ